MGTESDITINVLDFTEYPGPRYNNQGDDSGEDFYHNVLNIKFTAAYKAKVKLLIDLDNTAGYLTSFLDESFGNLVFDFNKEVVKSIIVFKSKQEPDWIKMIEKSVYEDWSKRSASNIPPKKNKNT